MAEERSSSAGKNFRYVSVFGCFFTLHQFVQHRGTFVVYRIVKFTDFFVTISLMRILEFGVDDGISERFTAFAPVNSSKKVNNFTRSEQRYKRIFSFVVVLSEFPQ
mgnify:CR=1 FL=1